jgi:recombination protein RecA
MMNGPHNNFIANNFVVHNSGKSTLAYYAIAQAQKMGKQCCYIDLEHSFDSERASQFGVDLDTLLIGSGFDNAEQALDTFLTMVKNKAVDFVVLDSVQALSPRGEQETKAGVVKSVEEDTMALLARKLSQFFRMSTSGIYKGNVSVLLIGQTRIGFKGIFALEQLSGGNALQHWSTLTIHATRGPKDESPTEKIEVEEDGETIKVKKIIGFQSIIKLDKTKISGTKVESSEVKLPFYFKEGYIRKENKNEEENNKKD